MPSAFFRIIVSESTHINHGSKMVVNRGSGAENACAAGTIGDRQMLPWQMKRIFITENQLL